MKITDAPATCFECDQGRYEIIVQPYSCRGQDGNVVVVPDVSFLRCTHCGVELIPAESDRYISRFVAEANEQLTKAELFAMLEKSGLSQKEYAEAIGLGEKTFHRWLKGTQVASRSMGYYLRAMQEFPEAFAWVKERGWRNQSIAKSSFVIKISVNEAPFPALSRRLSKADAWRSTIQHNPARALTLKATH